LSGVDIAMSGVVSETICRGDPWYHSGAWCGQNSFRYWRQHSHTNHANPY